MKTLLETRTPLTALAPENVEGTVESSRSLVCTNVIAHLRVSLSGNPERVIVESVDSCVQRLYDRDALRNVPAVPSIW